MHSVKYSTEEFGLERPLTADLLAYADQQAPCVIEYRSLHALMVQPEPEGPTHSAPHRSDGVRSMDS